MNNTTRVKPLVSVCMLTYNHEKYIAQAIDGVFMQQGDFEIELIITNDASRDKTGEVVNNYIQTHPKGQFIRYYEQQKNIGLLPNFLFVLQQSKGQYIAICSGDDYWTSPLKLQKQVDFLEKNPDCGLTHHDYERNINGTISASGKERFKIPSGSIFKELCVIDYISALTVCARTELMKECAGILTLEGVPRKWKQEDYPIWLELSLKSKIAYFPDKYSHYRILAVSASQNPSKTVQFEFAKSHHDIQMYFAERENVGTEIKDIIECHFQIRVLMYGIHIGDEELAYNAAKFLRSHIYPPSSHQIPPYKIKFYSWAGQYHALWLLLQALKRIKKNVTELQVKYMP